MAKELSKAELRIKQLSPIKQEAVRRLDKLRKYVLEQVWDGLEDILYGPAINHILDDIGNAKQCLTNGYDKDGKAV
jgi:hypothetical protein